MRKITYALLALLLLCSALFSTAVLAAGADDAWIERQLRAIENQYNSGIAPMSFVVGDIPWVDNATGRQYFTVSGLPSAITEAKWLETCATLAPLGYKIDNTGVKYTKFPQYETEGYHFVNVTINGVEVVRIGKMVPDDDPNGDPVYYYMTQKHVDSDDTSDGSGSHTGSISALLLPEDAKFQVNYAVDEYKYSYEIWLDGEDVSQKTIEETLRGQKHTDALIKEANGRTWAEYVFAGQNPSSTTGGAISFPVTIPYGYTAQVLRYQYDDATDTWLDTSVDLTSQVNDGHPLGTEPVYEHTVDDKAEPNLGKGPSAKTMSAVFNDDAIKQNRRIVVKLTPVAKAPIFDLHWWMGTANAGATNGGGDRRGTTAKNTEIKDANNKVIGYEPNLDGNNGKGDVDSEDQWNWKNGAFVDDPETLSGSKKTDYDTHWYQEDDGTWTLVWAFQTNKGNWIMNSLELNGVYIDVPFRSVYKGTNGNEETGYTKEDCTTVTTLPDGAKVELTYYRVFTYQDPGQRVYILRITGARSNITVTGGNLMLYSDGAPEYVATVLTGVTAKEDGTDSFGYYSQAGGWESQNKITVQVQGGDTPASGKTNFTDGDTAKHYGANLRFQLQDGYENPVFLWENRVSGKDLQGNRKDDGTQKENSVIPWSAVTAGNSEYLDNGKLKADYIYGPVEEDGGLWYYIRITPENRPGATDEQKMCVLNLTATAMKYMVRYMVGKQGDKDTNAPSEANGNVVGMPEFDTNDSNWDDDLIPKDDDGNPLPDGGGLEGQYLWRYDDNNGSFYDRQIASTIPVSDAQPATKDESKFFQYWVLVDKDENVIKEAGKPIIVRPNEIMDLARFAKHGVALGTDIGGTDNNYYVIRLKGVWSDLPSDFKFYIRMVWTDENGKSHIMDLVQNVTTSSTDPNLTEDGCLIVTVNTVTDTFKDWFKAHPFYAYAPRNFIATADRLKDDGFTDADGKEWERYPIDFTAGSAEQGLKNPNAYYRVEVGADGIVRYIVQRTGTIILYLDEVNGKLPVAKKVVGSNPGEDEFTYTVTVKLLPSDIKRASLPQGDPNYLTAESLKNMLPSGSYFGFAPDAGMIDLNAFTGTEVELHFRRSATGTNMANWFSTATFKLKGGEATVLGVPQGIYTITEDAGDAYTVTVETDGAKIAGKTIAGKEVEAAKTATAVVYTNEVKPVKVTNSPRVSTEIINLPAGLSETFGYTLTLVGGDASQVVYKGEGGTLTTTGAKVTGSPFDEITFNHTGTYQFLVTETLKTANAEENTIVPQESTRALTIEVENIDGQLTVTRITVDGTVYEGNAIANAVVPFTHNYMPTVPGSARVIPTVYKRLRGRDLLSASFKFELTTEDGKTYNATNNAAANGQRGTVTFPPLDLTLGRHEVTVKEFVPADGGAADHIDYDDSEIKITYIVEDVGGGLRVTQTTYDGNKDTFENQAYADAIVTVKKDYDLSLRPGGRWDGDTFTVTAKLISAPSNAGVDANGTTIALGGTAEIVLSENDKTAGKDFGFRFTNEGTYIFQVREKNGDIAGVSYDGSIYYVTAEVTAKGMSLAANLSITKNGKAVTGDTVTFENRFDYDKINVNVNALKELYDPDGRPIGLRDGRFRFQLTPVGNTPGGALTGTNDMAGEVVFTLQNLTAGRYVYTLSEITGAENGVEYDTRQYTVTIVVEPRQTSTGRDAVVATVTCSDANGNSVGTPSFKNRVRYYGILRVTKNVIGEGADKQKKFAFLVTLDDSTVNATYGQMVFIKGVAAFALQDGGYIDAALPAGLSYTVTETNPGGYNVRATNEKGTIKANTQIVASFVNEKIADGQPDAVPQTGDKSHVALWMALMLASIAAMCACIFALKKSAV